VRRRMRRVRERKRIEKVERIGSGTKGGEKQTKNAGGRKKKRRGGTKNGGGGAGGEKRK